MPHPRSVLACLSLLVAASPAQELPVAPAAPPAPVGAAPAAPVKPQALPEPEVGASRTASVVVYPEHAEITRVIRVQAEAGVNRVPFGNLIPILNPHTLRASVTDGARVIGTEITTTFLKESLSEEIKVLDAHMQQLVDLLAAEAAARARLDEQAAFYAGVKGRLAGDMGREFSASALAVADWGEVLGFVHAGLTRCDAERAVIEQRSRELKKELDALLAQRKEYAGRQPREMKEVVVSFHAERPGPVDAAIHYLVDAAVWRPSYDAQLDRATGELRLTGYGQVVQWSGEAWTDVELTLANTRPDFELALPELTPLQASLDAAQFAKIASEAAALAKMPQEGLAKWASGRFQRRQDQETFRRNLELLSRQSAGELAKLGINAEIVKGALARLANRLSAARYLIPQRETIAFNSSPTKIVAFDATVPARLRYVATPALGNSVLLQAEIVNTTGHPVLEGPVAMFIDGSFIGSTKQLGATQNEGLVLGFGPDDGLRVDRKLLSRTVKGFFGLSQVITYECEITVENFNAQGVEVEVTDQVPVSKAEDLKVAFGASNLPHALDAETGILRWTLQAEAGSRTTIDYSFTIECPAGKDVHWQ